MSGSTGGHTPTQVQENDALYEVVNIFSRKGAWNLTQLG